jgi:hypothetical protein
VRRAAGAFVLFAAALLLGAAGENFPIPKEENQIFYVQRSINSNTIVYTARLDGEGRFDTKKPVDVFWRRFNDDGERKELSTLERSLAFGVRADPAPGRPGAFIMRVVSYPQRSAVLKLVGGVPRLETKVAGEPSRLDHAYLEVDESGSVPSVTRVHLYGYSLATGKRVKESFIPW